ncbi:hypothetical protein NP493_183g02015 [Ridgeia piscesae]|uniref:Uncharacterized protein n=1 Tax=Ridgeia piscesae TaxID=27915 RepID=A0AAD9UF32_RIDPI|nr:hypothetical protein NP493_183g02015 [Ridgeia piscesae]
MYSTADPTINGDVSREVRQGESSRTSQAADKDIDTVEDAVVPHRQTRAASRLAAVSASEDERDDDEDQLLDPRSYLSSKRGSSQTTSPPEGIEPVISYVMMSSDDSETVAEPATSGMSF